MRGCSWCSLQVAQAWFSLDLVLSASNGAVRTMFYSNKLREECFHIQVYWNLRIWNGIREQWASSAWVILLLHIKLRLSKIYKIDKYRVIHKSLRDFRPLRYSSRDGHAEVVHVNRGRDTPIFYPTLQVLDMSTLGDAADVNPVIKFLLHSAMCVAGTWLQDCHLPRHRGWTYRAPVR
jgi:hypothetical protein